MIEELIYDELNRHLFQKAPELYRSLPDTDTMQRMAALIHATLVQRDAEGLTFLQRWERTGWKGLNNDQTVLIKALAKQKVAILEVLEVLNDEETRVRDRLDLARPPFIIRDQSLTGQVGRFTTSVSLIYEMPYYTRVNGVAALIPILNGLEAEEVIRSIALHQGVQAEGESLREWMLANYGLVAKSCEALHGAVQDAMAKNAKFTRISYQLTVPRHVFAKAMDTHPEVISNSPTVGGHTDDKTHEWAWKADPEPHMHGKIPVLGRVICNAQGVQLEAGGAKRIAALRNAFESFTGEMVRFHGQRVDDVGAQLRNRAPNAVDYTLVPPSLMASMPQLETSVYLVSEEQFQSTNGNAQKLAKTIQDWCHTPIPAFAGKKTDRSQPGSASTPQTDPDGKTNDRRRRSQGIKWFTLGQHCSNCRRTRT
jgi:hypothetical protein